MARLGAWTVCLLTVVCTLSVCLCYDEEKSRQNGGYKPGGIHEAHPFRMNKLNLMWEKAKKTLKENQLPSLYAELVIQDRLEVEWKKLKATGKDEDGQHEAVIHRKFLGILDQFQLRASYPAEGFKTKWVKDPAQQGSKLSFDEAIKSDAKLANLWKKAELAGFGERELDLLKEEFGHHAEKIEEYDQLRAEVDRLEGLSQNSIERFKSDDHLGGKSNGDAIKMKHTQLKSVYHDIKRSYENLERLTEQVVSGSEKRIEFIDPRVRELWSLAVKANLSEEELSSFKNELGHFEHRINKFNHFDKEMHISQADLNMRGKRDQDLPDSHLKLSQKVHEYASKVKKWYTELKSRILKASPHSSDEF